MSYCLSYYLVSDKDYMNGDTISVLVLEERKQRITHFYDIAVVAIKLILHHLHRLFLILILKMLKYVEIFMNFIWKMLFMLT